MKRKLLVKCRRRLIQNSVRWGGDIKIGDKVKMKKNHQVGEVIEMRGKRAVVKIGLLPNAGRHKGSGCRKGEENRRKNKKSETFYGVSLHI